MKVRNVIVRAALFGFSGLALNAYATQHIEVIGTITRGACTADFGGTGYLSYGDIPYASLKYYGWNILPQKTSTLTIDCPDAVKNSAFYAIDSNHVSAIESDVKAVIDGETVNGGHVDNTFNFGLGQDPNHTSIGNYSITPVKVTVDGVDMPRYNTTTSHTDNTGFPNRQKFKSWSYRHGEDWAAADASDNRPAGTTVVWTMVVEPQIRPASYLSPSAYILFGGTAKFNIRYW